MSHSFGIQILGNVEKWWYKWGCPPFLLTFEWIPSVWGCSVAIPFHVQHLYCRCMVEAWGLLQQHTTKLNIEELLKHMYEICQEMGLMEDLLKLPFTDTEKVSLEKKPKTLHCLFGKRRGRMVIAVWNVLFLTGVFGEVFTDQIWCSESWIPFSPPSAACQLHPSTPAESVHEDQSDGKGRCPAECGSFWLCDWSLLIVLKKNSAFILFFERLGISSYISSCSWQLHLKVGWNNFTTANCHVNL